MRKHWTKAMATLAGLAIGAPLAAAALAAEPEEDVVITATRIAQAEDEAPSTVSVVTDAEIDNNLVTDIKDLVRFEPGVSVRQSPKRFGAAQGVTGRDGNSGFNIRGIEGNRVLIQVDGVRLPDAFEFGPQNVGRGDYVDLDLLRSVEILRGPGSSLYGSDGLAGIVSFTTKDPEHILVGEETFALRTRAAYASADDSIAGGAAAAGTWGDWQALLAITHRYGHEQETQGENEAENSTRTAANPEDNTTTGALGKLIFAPSDNQRIRLTLDHQQSESVMEVFSGRAATPPALGAGSVIDLDALDESTRDRATLDYRYDGAGLIERAIAALYWQRSETEQFSDEDRFTSPDRTRLSTFDNEVWGLSTQLDARFSTGSAGHLLTFGGDYSLTTQQAIRDGTVASAGDVFPSRPFPTSDYVLAGAFVQDELSLNGGTIKLYPALRYDYYDLDPKPDALYTGLPSAGQSDSHVSPKFGVVLWPWERFGLFANLAQGFKAPSPSQVNNGFVNPVQGYQTISNPGLEPEKSISLEGGARTRELDFGGAIWNGGASAFVARYDDFIDRKQLSGTFGNPMDPAVFQYQNIGGVEIRGAEARLRGLWDNGLGVNAAVSYAHGQSRLNGVETPLATVEPLKFVAGLSYDAPSNRFGGQLIATYSQGEDAERSGCAPTCFLPPDFTILDATAYWNLTDRAALRVGVFNITDEKYWWWGDVRGLAAASAVRDAYTQPGRNYSASISYRF